MVDVGTVRPRLGDGIASIQGLQGVRSNELLDFGNDVLGLALNLEADLVGAAILGDPNAVKEGDRVRSTGRIIEVPVGDALIGRVVDPLGRPLDGKGPVNTRDTRSVGENRPQRGGAQIGGHPGADGHQGHRLHDSHRPGASGS